MQERDGAIEILPQGRRARRHEADVVAAHLIAARPCVLVLGRRGSRQDEKQRSREADNELHLISLR